MSEPIPTSVLFFPNGMAAVCDQFGAQMPNLQGKHRDTVKALADAGHPWHTLPSIMGSPSMGLAPWEEEAT